jgi:hypothetical protein
MTTTSQPIVAVEGAIRLLRALRPHLPDDAVWVLSEGEEDVYWLTIYGETGDPIELREQIADVLNELWRESTPFAVLFGSKEALANLPQEVERRGVDWQP